MTCDNDNYDDGVLADILQVGLLRYDRIGNKFVSADFSFACGNNNFNDFRIQCSINGAAETCKPAPKYI